MIVEKRQLQGALRQSVPTSLSFRKVAATTYYDGEMTGFAELLPDIILYFVCLHWSPYSNLRLFGSGAPDRLSERQAIQLIQLMQTVDDKGLYHASPALDRLAEFEDDILAKFKVEMLIIGRGISDGIAFRELENPVVLPAGYEYSLAMDVLDDQDLSQYLSGSK